MFRRIDNSLNFGCCKGNDLAGNKVTMILYENLSTRYCDFIRVLNPKVTEIQSEDVSDNELEALIGSDHYPLATRLTKVGNHKFRVTCWNIEGIAWVGGY